ncbi:MAG: aminopeptidase P family protein [Breznakibacter sp.]
MNIQDRLFALRSAMGAFGLDAYIVSSADPHLSEYVADHWKFREWLSGFTGSAGTLVVTEEVAALWTDSRYYLQAEEQLKDSGIDLFKAGLPDTPTYVQWLAQELLPAQTVGFDGRLFTVEEIRQTMRDLKKHQILVDSNKTLIDEAWPTRPPIPDNTVFEHSKRIAGYGRRQKFDIIRGEMEKAGATHYVTAALDEIAWTLNLRGNDVDYNPVFYAYLVIDEETAHLFTNPHKIKASIGKGLAEDDVKTSLYDDFYDHLKDLFAQESHVYYDPKRTNGAILSALPATVAKTEGASFIANLKAIKNEAEKAAIDKAMVKDGVAMVEFWHWLESSLENEPITETSTVKKAKAFRARHDGFWGESFATIAGYAANGAIVHYKPTEGNDAVLKPEGLFLFDSGAQFAEGTTDLTRTFALGHVDATAKHDYTLVLKGHIALANACFPTGTKGYQLDGFARQFLWNNGLNYGHGTGHGIGCFLNVHEGPHGIGPQPNMVSIDAGMITSNEPGLYRTNQYGIRIENLLLVENHCKTEFGAFLKFSTITLCPIDTRPIEAALLTDDELEWLNTYHQTVYKKLEPLLTGQLKTFLANKCRPLER